MLPKVEISREYYEISEAGFERSLVRDNAGIFILYRKTATDFERLHVGAADHLADGVLAAKKSYPSATHWKYYLCLVVEHSMCLEAVQQYLGA